MSGVFGGGGPKSARVVSPDRSEEDALEAVRLQRTRRSMAFGRGNTILTSGLGASQSDDSLGTKTLLGA